MVAHFLQNAVDARIEGPVLDQSNKTRFQYGPLGRVGLCVIGLQVLVELPNLTTHFLDVLAVRVVVRHQLAQRSLGVNPAASMHEDDELRGPIAEHHQIRRDATGDQAAQQCSLRGHAHMPFVGNGQFREPGLPGLLAVELLRSLSQLPHERRR